MERVAFLVEGTGERIGCLLNPESIIVRRTAGVRPRRSAAGLLTGAALADDPILYTGGGTTEIDLDLLFDVTLPGSSAPTVSSTPTGARPALPVLEDVRVLTGPLRQLAEGPVVTGESPAPPV